MARRARSLSPASDRGRDHHGRNHHSRGYQSRRGQHHEDVENHHRHNARERDERRSPSPRRHDNHGRRNDDRGRNNNRSPAPRDSKVRPQDESGPRLDNNAAPAPQPARVVTILSVRENAVETRGSVATNDFEIFLRGMSREQSDATNFVTSVGDTFHYRYRRRTVRENEILRAHVLDMMEEQTYGLYAAREVAL